MKRTLTAIILMLCLIVTTCAGAEGLLPSLDEIIGKPMLSLGEAIGRYPDEEIPEEDGGITEVFRNITKTDYDTFSVYLSEKGAALAEYQIDGSALIASIQAEGSNITFTYDTQTLEARVTYPKGTYDEWLDSARTQFESVTRLLDDGKTDDAVYALLSIPGYRGYRPAREYLEAHPEFAAAVRDANIIACLHSDRFITFGKYEQDDITSDGKEPIEWMVLDYDAAGNRALLISRYGLDAKPYSEKSADFTWDKCTLRPWLNNEFLKSAFSSEEQNAILVTEVDNSMSQGYSDWNISSGNDTQDKIFLLSYAEADQYLGVESGNMKARTSPTAYALQSGAWTGSNRTADGAAAGLCWLRSPGNSVQTAAAVNSDGALGWYGVNNGTVCVRPALWINLESGIF